MKNMISILLPLLLAMVPAPLIHAQQRDVFGNIFSGVSSMVDSAVNSASSAFGGGRGGGGGGLGGFGSGLGGFGGLRDFDRSIPIIGSCDRIVYAGVGNCMTNFGPTSVGSKGPCCAYRKYRACINGLRDGHAFAVARKRCPQSFTTGAIHRVSESVIGVPLSSCKDDRNACGNRRKSTGANGNTRRG